MASTLTLPGALPFARTFEKNSSAPPSWPQNWSAPSEDDTARGIHVLIVDDDPLVREVLRRHLAAVGYLVEAAENSDDAHRRITEETCVVLLDLRLPGVDGLDCLRSLRQSYRDAQVIVMTASDDVRDAVEAMKLGAYEYLTKPLDPSVLLPLMRQAAKNALLAKEHQGLRAAVVTPQTAAELPAVDQKTQTLLRQVERIAQLDSTVLITGESGTGKTTLARMIHQRGPRANGPFVAVNCASLPRDLIEAELFGHKRGAFTGASYDRPGRVEIADGGTLLLDEIGDLPLELQPKLLTFLQDRTVQRIGSNEMRTVDVRLIVATHQPLMTMCQERKFREDLFYRLNVLSLEVPPLRERTADLPQLIQAIQERISHRRGGRKLPLTPAAMDLLLHHSWPGNIRELENVLERASAYCEGAAIDASDLKISLPTSSQGGAAPVGSGPGRDLAGRTLDDIERQAIIETLHAFRGNKARSARALGISEKSIYNKMRRLGIAFDIVKPS